MRKNIILSLIAILLFLGEELTWADPSIDNTTGAWIHKSAVTITGFGFGSKVPAEPLKWDDAEDKTMNDFSSILAEYSHANPGSFAGCPDPWKIQYRNAPYTAVTTPVEAPHSHSTKYIVGGHHEDNTGDHEGRSVQVTVATSSGFEERWFATWYYTLDPAWPSCGNSPNHKIITIQSGTQAYSNYPYTNQFFYMCLYSPNPCAGNSYVGTNYMGNFSSSWCDYWYPNPTACPSSSPLGSGVQWRGNSPANNNWVRLESRISNDQGFLHFLIDNHYTAKHENRPNWVNNTNISSGIRSFSVGGYYRYYLNGAGFQHNNAFRYFDDIYIDCTLSRVVLANNSNYDNATIIEPQIPSIWASNGNSITCTVNLGKLPDSGTAYLFVFDADNNHNPTGFPVQIRTSTGPGTGPSAPGALRMPIWKATQQMGDTEWKDSFTTYCVRLLVEGNYVTVSGNKVRLGLQGRGTGGYVIKKVSIAERDISGSLGDVVDFTWTKVTFDGNSETTWTNDIVIVPAGQEKLSDPIPFSIQAGKDYYVTFKIETPSVYLNPPSSYQELYFSTEDYTDDKDWSGIGYSTVQDYHALSSICVLD